MTENEEVLEKARISFVEFLNNGNEDNRKKFIKDLKEATNLGIEVSWIGHPGVIMEIVHPAAKK